MILGILMWWKLKEKRFILYTQYNFMCYIIYKFKNSNHDKCYTFEFKYNYMDIYDIIARVKYNIIMRKNASVDSYYREYIWLKQQVFKKIIPGSPVAWYIYGIKKKTALIIIRLHMLRILVVL